MKTDTGRQAFVNDITTVYAMYDLDGIDIDWEYPSQQGDQSNYVDRDDTVHFLEFLKLLRANLPPPARISAAVQTTPFADANGYPMDDVREFAAVLDWFLIMNYDAWGGEFCITWRFSGLSPQTLPQFHRTLVRMHPLATPVATLHSQRLARSPR
jgi:GH18 family chitinase